ncbi:formylglycine-generating enzyme family protein [candidate division KSB1 bacterium]
MPAGKFEMGDNFGEGNSDEVPVHTVYLDDYYIGKYEVTNAQYAEFLNARGNQPEGETGWFHIDSEYAMIDVVNGRYVVDEGYDYHPVVEVSWYGAKAYCDWMNEQLGLPSCYDEYDVDLSRPGYRLPTEAEWEKAARGDSLKNASLGHQRRYPWGDEMHPSYANYGQSFPAHKKTTLAKTTPVGYYDGKVKGRLKMSNGKSPYGAHDMAGNVIEWCSDWYDPEYYEKSPAKNPTGKPEGTTRVLRGGSWYNYYPLTQRSAIRIIMHPYSTYSNIGFRCVRTK